MKRLHQIRDAAWQAFWRRQIKHLPPAARVAIINCTIYGSQTPGPALQIDIGRRAKSPTDNGTVAIHTDATWGDPFEHGTY